MITNGFDGFVPMKRWLFEEAVRDGVLPSTIWRRLRKAGWYKGRIKLKKINKRVIFVQDSIFPSGKTA